MLVSRETSSHQGFHYDLPDEDVVSVVQCTNECFFLNKLEENKVSFRPSRIRTPKQLLVAFPPKLLQPLAADER